MDLNLLLNLLFVIIAMVSLNLAMRLHTRDADLFATINLIKLSVACSFTLMVVTNASQ